MAKADRRYDPVRPIIERLSERKRKRCVGIVVTTKFEAQDVE